MNIKLILAILAAIVGVAGFYPYLRDIFKKETKPHVYTWLIWSITLGTAAAGVVKGEGGYGALVFVLETFLNFFVFLLAFKYGSNNITRGDTVSLIAALLAILIWWQLGNPLLAVLMVSLIDGIGYIPTYRKTYKEPRSETPSFWLLMVVSDILFILSLAEYNLLTLSYVIVLTVSNIAVLSICLLRRAPKDVLQ